MLIGTADFCLGTLPAYLSSGRDCLRVSTKIRFVAGQLDNPGFWIRQLREKDAGEANNDEYHTQPSLNLRRATIPQAN
jgi:hypothetical protein